MIAVFDALMYKMPQKALEIKDIHGQNATYLYYDGRNPKLEVYTVVLFIIIDLPTGKQTGSRNCASTWRIAKDCGVDKFLVTSSVFLDAWYCEDCPSGAFCPMNQADPQIMYGYWRVPNEWLVGQK